MGALLSWVNHVDLDATILSSSGHVGDLSPSNLADPIIGKRWRTTNLTGYAQADFVGNKTVGVCAIAFPRDTVFPLSGSVRWRMDADGGTPGTGAANDSGVISLGLADGYGYHLYKPTNNVTARYVRFTFSGVGGVSYIDVGRMWAGEVWQPTVDVAGGYDDEWTDLSRVHVATRSGAEYPDRRPKQRVFAFALEALTTAERDQVRELGRLTGVSEQFLISLNPTSFQKETAIGRMIATTPIRHRALSDNLYGKAFAVRESL